MDSIPKAHEKSLRQGKFLDLDTWSYAWWMNTPWDAL